MSVVKAQLATEYWTQQAEQGQKIADEVNKGVASVLSEQRIAAQQDLHDTLKSKAQELTEKFGKEISDELKEQYNKLAQVRPVAHWNLPRCPRFHVFFVVKCSEAAPVHIELNAAHFGEQISLFHCRQQWERHMSVVYAAGWCNVTALCVEC